MADGDYICVYRQFFEEFAKSSELEDHRPMRLNIYSLPLDELVGEVIQSCVNFLTERQCPNSLVVPLTRIVVEELLSEVRKQPEEVDNPLKLNKKTREKIYEVCHRYTDNEKLSSLPPPVPETPYSTHSTKHTRRRMEDRYICLPRFNTLHGIQCNSEAEYYGIFDGHAGVTAASFAVSHLHQFLAESPYYPGDPVRAFRDAYEKTESRFNSKNEESGTTSLAILHQPAERKLTVSWVGDSQALLVTQDGYVMLVNSHVPDREDEKKRIESLGGFVLISQSIVRVNGELAISRAIGDRKMKPYVSAEPEFQVVNLTGVEHFVVMGCDGLWDVVDPEQVIETVYFELKNKGGQVDTVARRLVDLAKENHSEDNISVIVFFLTDPLELKNRSVDVTGHRPKIIDQNGLIMDANYQASDSSLNGIYETSNGNYHVLNHNSHEGYENQTRNESDDDLGPETDVDAIDDVLMSPVKSAAAAAAAAAAANNDLFEGQTWMEYNHSGDIMHFSDSVKDQNPFKMNEDPGNEYDLSVRGDKIEVEGITENDVTNMKFMNNNMDGEHEENKDEILDFENEKYKSSVVEPSLGDTYDERWQQEETKSNKLSEDDQNAFEESVINNYSDAFNVKTNGSDDNKCVSEIDHAETEKTEMNQTANFDSYELDSRKEEEPEKLDDQPDDKPVENLPIEPAAVENMDKQNDDENAFGKMVEPVIGDVPPEMEVSDDVASPEMDTQEDFFAGEKSPNEKSEREALSPAPLDNYQSEMRDIDQTETDFMKTENEMIYGVGEDPPKFCSVTDVCQGRLTGSVDLSQVEMIEMPQDEAQVVEESPQLLMPTAPAADGDVKDEIVGESSGEVEDSEDDEWNYIKVGSQGVGVSSEDQPADLISSDQQVQDTKAVAMNSPLNPDAAEFVPVSPMATGDHDVFGIMETPVKNLPRDLEADDIVASSPNWMSMGHVSVPEESAFMNEIKSRPSHIMDDLNFAQQKEFDAYKAETEEEGEKKKEILDEFEDFGATKEVDNKPDAMSPEPQGIALATDMTGSFIDTSTMSYGEDFPQKNESFVPEIKEPIAEERLMHLTSEKPEPQEAVILEQPKITSEITELVSPGHVDDGVSPISLTPATPKSTAVEVASSPESEASTLPITDVQPSPLLDLDVKPVETSPQIPDITSPVTEPSKPAESPVIDESKDKTVAAAAVAGAAAVAAGVAAAVAVKKDDKKATPKTAPGKTTKPTSTKPAVSDAKAATATKRPSTVTKTTTTAKTSTNGTSATTPVKAAASKLSSVSKTAPKSPSSMTSPASKTTAARPKPAATTTVSRTPLTRTTVTATTVKSTTTAPKPAARTAAKPSLTSAAKPRVSSAPLDKKTTMNGDLKTTVKRAETTTTTRKPLGATTLTTTRVSLTSRPATAPAKPAATSKTTVTTTTRTLTAKPRTAISNTTATTTTSTVTTTGRVSSVTKRTTLGSEKQAKEMANRLTSKTMTSSSTVKMNGVSPGKTTGGSAAMKTMKKTTTTTTTKTGSSPTKAKPVSKTENKAETIVNKTIEIVQSESENPLIENTNEMNLINSIASD